MDRQIIFQEPPSEFKPKFTCAAVFVEVEDKILLLKRQNHKTEPGRWGHPAGKVDMGEAVSVAAQRELFEETGIEIGLDELEFRTNVFVRYPEYDFVFAMYRVKMLEKPDVTIRSDEHQTFAWVTLSEIRDMDMVTGTKECMDIFYSL